MSALQPHDLRTERQIDPLGIDDHTPVLAWKLAGSGQRKKQTGYRIRVVIDGDPHDESLRAVWDSGFVASGDNVDSPYAGEQLQSKTRYVWAVRVLDENGVDSGWSGAASFETGLWDWTASWISSPDEPLRTAKLDVARHPHNIERIWLPRSDDDDIPTGNARFRTRVDGDNVVAAVLFADAGPSVRLRAFVGDVEVPCDGTDIATAFVGGENTLSIEVFAATQPGLAARLELERSDGSTTVRGTDAGWECCAMAEEGADPAWLLSESYGPHGAPPLGRSPQTYRPSPFLRKEFTLSTPIRRARLRVTALGLYEARINGTRVGDDRLTPGWTDYRMRVPYQTHDVTELLRVGANAIGAILADGWYAGNVGWLGSFLYGKIRAFRAELEVEHVDGSRTVVLSDGSWKTSEGEIYYADLQNGEVVDRRSEQIGWDTAKTTDTTDTAAFDDSTWNPVNVVDPPHGPLEAAVAPPIRIGRRLPVRNTVLREPGRVIVDFGQNLVGWVRIRVSGSAGSRVMLRHAEVVDHRGELYLEALRTARATDEYVLRGDADGEVFEPRFTVHGFRYCEIRGADVDIREVVALAAYADMEPIGEFSCSDSRISKLQQNIVWGQRGNFLSVPTDCPQRDERLGWTGDAQVFASTAMFNYDVRGFFRKWLRDIYDAQHSDGGVPHVVPDVLTMRNDRPKTAGGAGWADVIAVLPLDLLWSYGDVRSVAETYDRVVSWLGYLERNSDGYIRPDERFGDWLALVHTPNDLVNTAFFAYTAWLATDLAGIINRTSDIEKWDALYSRIRQAFRARFVRGGGSIVSGTQAAYVLALHFGLFDPSEEARAARRLVDEIARRNWHLTTGFLGTPYLLSVLSRFGYHDVALELLAQDEYPSWLYPVVHGDATTVWERWDSWNDAHGFQDPGMTSFNHYAYGAVGAWIYRHVGGLAPGAPGYQHVIVCPRPGVGITWAKTSLETPYGKTSVHWQLDDERMTLDVTIPPNVTAEVWLPDAAEPEQIGSGSYHFEG